MKRQIRLVLLVAVAIVFTATQRADSQNRTSNTLTDTESGGLGFRPFAPGFELARAQDFSRFKFEVDGNVRRTRKVDGGGFSFGGSAAIRVPWNDLVYVLAGARINEQHAASFVKRSVWPFAGIGSETDSYTLSARYLFPDLASANRGHGPEVRAEYRWSLAPDGSFGVLAKTSVGYQRARCHQAAQRLEDTCNGVYTTSGVGFYF